MVAGLCTYETWDSNTQYYIHAVNNEDLAWVSAVIQSVLSGFVIPVERACLPRRSPVSLGFHLLSKLLLFPGLVHLRAPQVSLYNHLLRRTLDQPAWTLRRQDEFELLVPWLLFLSVARVFPPDMIHSNPARVRKCHILEIFRPHFQLWKWKKQQVHFFYKLLRLTVVKCTVLLRSLHFWELPRSTKTDCLLQVKGLKITPNNPSKNNLNTARSRLVDQIPFMNWSGIS